MIGAARATFNETHKGLLVMWDYRFSMLMEFIGIGLVFIGIVFFVGQGELTQESLSSSMVGFIITYYAMNVISNMSWTLMQEAQAGTLEQMYMSPMPSSLIVLGRSLSSFVVSTVQLLLIVTVMVIALNIPLPLKWEIIPVVAVTIIGLMGFGYVVGSMALVFKQIGPLANLVQNALLFLNGTFLPISQMPGWLATIATFIPSTQGIVVLRKIMLEDASLADVIADGSFPLLMFHSAAFFVVGLVVFTYCEGIARRQGTLGQY